MGRPKKNTVDLSATEKIENAFWKIMEFEDFENITILRLTKETGLNRNTIYYHYRNLEDLTKKAIEHNIEQQDVRNIAASIFFDNIDYSLESEFFLHVKRTHLLARSNSPYLQSFIKIKFINTWIEYFGIDSNKMSDSDWVSIEFIASGITGIIGNKSFVENPQLVNAFTTSFIRNTVYQALQNFPKKV